MTVEELIDKLEKIEDTSMEVQVRNAAGDFDYLETLEIETRTVPDISEGYPSDKYKEIQSLLLDT